MKREEFENYCKYVLGKNTRKFMIVRLRNATFYIDNYYFRGNKSDEVNFIWKNAIIGHCKIKSVMKVY
jgi:hypothetical protein